MISKILFLVLLFLLPVNLGYHFVVREAYVTGILSDYLIPTVYLQDIIALLLVLSEFLKGIKKPGFLEVMNKRHAQLLIFFLFSVFLSVALSSRKIPSYYAFARLFLYSLVFLYVQSQIKVGKFFRRYIWFILASFFLVCILGVIQYAKQSSVFNNYLFFGEQPYSFSSPEIVKENVFGFSRVPPYGLFRHPNTFGGYLSIILLWLYYLITERSRFQIPKNLGRVLFGLGFLTLVLTFSYFSWIAFFAGVFFLHIVGSDPLRRIFFTVFIVLIATTLFLPFISDYTRLGDESSVYRRSNLLKASYKIIDKYYFYGVGYNNSTAEMEKYAYKSKDIRFNQPVHNIFVLTFVESGVYSLLFLLLLISLALSSSLKDISGYKNVIFVSLIQILVLGSMDHYLFTIHQTHLLFWVIMGLAFSKS